VNEVTTLKPVTDIKRFATFASYYTVNTSTVYIESTKVQHKQDGRVLELAINAVRLKVIWQKVEIVGGNSTCATLLIALLSKSNFTLPKTTFYG